MKTTTQVISAVMAGVFFIMAGCLLLHALQTSKSAELPPVCHTSSPSSSSSPSDSHQSKGMARCCDRGVMKSVEPFKAQLITWAFSSLCLPVSLAKHEILAGDTILWDDHLIGDSVNQRLSKLSLLRV